MQVRFAAKVTLTLVAAGTILSACAAAPGTPGSTPGVVPVPPGAVPAVPADQETPGTALDPTPAPAESAASIDTAASPASAQIRDTRQGDELNKPFSVDGVIVVSPGHPLGPNYKPPEQVGDDHLTPNTAKAAQRLLKAAREDGLTALIRSGYRSYQTQKTMLAAKAKNYPSREAELNYIAEPGTSEHQTGLAVDFWDGQHWSNDMGDTPLMKWLAVHAREYGFILRYPPGKKNITGYAYESWHFRYVGPDVSMKFKPKSDETLEEYLGLV